ncbi:hypothetical protein [Kibdelosporangium phytohabitans]|uniref:Uncharacterized protein n=1 Tax=Kibdelosporangium phytohabitans TaxID=860235 RepID=A0A0N9IC67_9PSEU|nr:hypothetical protein [Kibdelosporangium phytohabitans]ALG12306.1 hypothetical protein AOZ06_40475 [Kibdelosporangium phytohabitans]MBE1463863.1 hypothetical protein [Kibdelosporangium phytohabitans]
MRIESMVVLGMDNGKALHPYDLDGSVVLRKPKGHYMVDTHIPAEDSYTHVFLPSLTLHHDQSLTLDARQAKPVRPAVPNPKVTAALLDAGLVRLFDTPDGRSGFLSGAILSGGPPFHGLHQGPPLRPDELGAWMAVKLGEPGKGNDFTGSPVMYHLLWQAHGTCPTGFEPVVRQDELAEIRQRYHATPAGKFGYTWTFGYLEGLGHLATGGPLGVPLPFERTEYFQRAGRGRRVSASTATRASIPRAATSTAAPRSANRERARSGTGTGVCSRRRSKPPRTRRRTICPPGPATR